MTHPLRALARRVRGASLVEYGITVGLVSVLAIGSVLALGGEVRSTFVTVEETLSSNIGSASADVGSDDPSPLVYQTDDIVWQFTAASMGSRVGFSDGMAGTTAGDLSVINAGIGAPRRFTVSSTQTFFYIDGDVSGTLADHTLTCSTDAAPGMSIPSPSGGGYSTFYDATSLFWAGGTGPAFTVGETYTCIFAGP